MSCSVLIARESLKRRYKGVKMQKRKNLFFVICSQFERPKGKVVLQSSLSPPSVLQLSSKPPPSLLQASSKPPPSLLQTSKIYRKSIENLSNIYRTSIENLSKIYRTSIEHLSKIYRKIYRKPIENRSENTETAQYRARRHEMKNF